MPDFNLRNYYKASEEKLGNEIPKGRRQFSVPLNQRPFVWKKLHITSLWKDFFNQVIINYTPIENNETWVERNQLDGYPHFIGNFIFVTQDVDNNQSELAEVYDGQQRLTALSMLAASLLDHAHALNLACPNDQILLDTLAELRSWVVARPGPNEHRPRVLVDISFRELFDALIVLNRNKVDRENAVKALSINFSTNKDHDNLYKRFSEMYELVNDKFLSMELAEQRRFLLAACATLNRSFVGIVTSVNYEAYGLKIFASLNTLAHPLTAVDNIKNELFVRINRNQHSQVSTLWRQMIDSLVGISPKEFLRRRLIGNGHACANDDVSIFEKLKEHDLGTKSSHLLVSLLSVLQSEAGVLRSIREGTGFSTNTQRYLYDIYKILGASLADIFLLAAHRELMPHSPLDFETCAKLIRNFLFRELTIRDQDTPFIEKRLQNAALTLRNAGVPGLRVLLQSISNDDVFEKDFSEKVDSRVRIQFFVLYCIEEYLSMQQGLVPYKNSPSQHIEHIVPKNIEKKLPNGSDAWPFWKNKRRSFHARYLNRFGNLLILEANINSSIGNLSFEEKSKGIKLQRNGAAKRKVGYIDSQLKLAKRLAKCNLAGFFSIDIERRQKLMAKIALLVWGFQ